MDFNVNDFFLEADDEAKKEEDKKKDEEKKDDEKKESESKEDKKEKDDKSSDEDDSEYNDLMDDDTNSDSSDDDEYNDLMDDDIGDLSADDDEPVADDSSDDYNTLIVVKGGDKDGCCEGCIYDKLAKLGYLFTVISNNMKHIHLNCAGKKFEEIHRASEEYYYHFNSKSDQYFELAAEYSGVKLDNPTRAKEHVEDIEVESEENYTFDNAISRMTDNFNKAIEYIKCARECAGNDRTDIQSTLDEELTYLNKQCNFILRKKLIVDDTVTPPMEPPVTESYNWLF
jgi:DNA-binding ferritin-like protein